MLINKYFARKAAKYFYDLHVNCLLKLPPDYATATEKDRETIIYHEKAAIIYLWLLKDLS